MPFAYDTSLALQAAATLVNSAETPQTMCRIQDLADFLDGFGYTGRIDGDEPELYAVRRLRPRLRDLLLGDEETLVERVNQILTETRAVPQLVRHDDLGWHLHAVSEDAPLATRILVETAMAVIDLIRAGELSRLGVCADEDCEGVVVDLSRNRSRRYCEVTCANRNAQAAHRARLRAAQGLAAAVAVTSYVLAARATETDDVPRDPDKAALPDPSRAPRVAGSRAGRVRWWVFQRRPVRTGTASAMRRLVVGPVVVTLPGTFCQGPPLTL